MNIAEYRALRPELAGLTDDGVVDALHTAYYSDMPRDAVAKALGVAPAAPVAAPSSFVDRAKDVGISALKGAIGVPEAAVGLLDIPTGGRVGKVLESAGFRPKEAKAMLDEGYSAAQKQAFQNVENADGIVDITAAALQNPSAVVHSVVQSLPAMGAGGVLARAARVAMPALGAVGAGALGEGVVASGAAAEQIRQQTESGLLDPRQSAIAAVSGAATGGLGLLGGKIAQRLGIADVDTMLAGATVNAAARKGVVRRVLEGAASEGLLEELPQSVSEQVLQNLALNKPLDEGVDQAAVMGALAGAAMGGGANIMAGGPEKPQGPLARAAAAAQPPAAAPLALGGPVFDVAPDGTVSTGADRNAAAQDALARRGGITESGAIGGGRNGDVIDVESRDANQPPALAEQAPAAINKGAQDAASMGDPAGTAGAVPAAGNADGSDLLGAGAQRPGTEPGREEPAAGLLPADTGAPAAVPRDADAGRRAGDAVGDAGAQGRGDDGVAESQGPGTFPTLSEAQDYISGQRKRGSSISALPFERADGSFSAAVKGTPDYDEALVQRAARERADSNAKAGVLPGDVLNREGEPFKARIGAVNALKKAPDAGTIHKLPNGQFVIRKAANVEDAPAPAPGRTEAAPAPAEAPAPNRRDAAVPAEGLPAAGTAGVEADGVKPAPGWALFDKATGTLGKPRAEMPQIKAEHRGALVNFLGARGVKHERVEVAPGSLRPTQAEYEMDRVEKAMDTEGDRSILISSDGHLLDGHHQWIAAGARGDATVKAIRLDAPIKELLPLASEFPSATSGAGAAPTIVEHTTGRNKVLRGVVRTDLDETGAKAIDPYTFKKDGGWFIREKYLADKPSNQPPALAEQAPAATKEVAKPKPVPAPAPAADQAPVKQKPTAAQIDAAIDAGVPFVKEVKDGATLESLTRQALDQRAKEAAKKAIPSDVSEPSITRRANPGAMGDRTFVARAWLNNDTAVQGQGQTEAEALQDLVKDADAKRSAAPAAVASPPGVVSIPSAISDALDADIQAQKSRVTRLRNKAGKDGMTLDEKTRAQTMLKGAEFNLRKMRTTRFDAEDAALEALKQKDMAPFAEHIAFPKAEKALRELLGGAGNAQSSRPAAPVDDANTRARNWAERTAMPEERAEMAAAALAAAPAPAVNQAPSKYKDMEKIEPAIAAVREHVDGKIDKAALIDRLRPLGLTEAQVGSVTMKLQDDFTAADIRAVMAPKPVPEASAKRKVSAAETRAKADLMSALADLGDILGKNTRMNMMPEQEQKLLPVLTRVLDAAFRLGYHKFKDAAKFSLDQIRANLGDDAAEAITLDHLQGAYISANGSKQAMGADTKRAVIDVESKDDIENHTPTTTNEATQDEPAARSVEGPGGPELAGEPASDGQATEAGRDVREGAGRGGVGDGPNDADAAGQRLPASGSPAPGPAAAPLPAAGARDAGADGAGRGGAPVPRRAKRFSERANARGAAGVDANPAPNAPAAPAPQFQPTDFTIAEDFALGEGGEKTKFRANVAAIELLQRLQATGAMATPEEQQVLARYVGWGGLANAFEGGNADWAREQAQLKALLPADDYAAAARSTRYAHYTSREIIQDGIYAALQRFGFAGGKVLEGGAGVGNFIGLMPDAMRSAGRVTAVEREPIAAGIARQLYPQQNVVREDFTVFQGTDDYFDAAVGNPPFASDTQVDQSGRKHLNGLSLHNYFFAKNVDMLREGGILAQVVTNSFMDAKGDVARRYISDRTKLLGAIRLPNNAFSKNAGTEVTTDLIFLQKRPEAEWGSRAARQEAKQWLDTGTYTDKNGAQVALNQYFIDHPDMMLGDFGAFGTMYRKGSTALVAADGQDTGALLRAAVAKLPEGVYQSAAVQGTTSQVNAAIVALRDPPVAEGGFFEDGGRLIRRDSDLGGEARGEVITPETQWTEKTKLGPVGFDRIQRLSRMRSTLRGLIAAEMANDDRGMGTLREQLNQQYDEFTQTHGLINDAGNARVFDDDPDYPLLASLEHGYTPAIGPVAAKAAGIKPVKSKATKAPIFSRRVVAERKAVTKVESPADAIAVSMAERGRLDTAYIGKLLGRDPADALHEMTTGDRPLLFKDPGTGEFVLRDAYLSGNVRQKLQTAKQAGMFQNVRALDEVQPADVGAHEIVARVGSPWVPESVYEDFAKAILGDGTKASVRYVKANSSYGVYITPGSSVANTNTWGTPSYSGSELLAALLNNRQIKVTHKVGDKTVVDIKATEAANIKAQDIRNKFSDWLFTDATRSELLVRAYNDTNNNYVVRQYDGAFMDFPGKVPDDVIRFRRHQRNAISRIVQDRTALLDHEVGAGKTFTVIAGMMELKRTGLANKPMVIVPNHLVKQWAADWYRLYPGANILTATKKDFEKANRRRFLAKIATGDWDAVVMAHSSFGFIKPSPEFEAQFNEKQIDLIVDAIREVENGDSDGTAKKRTVKQLEGLKERLENRIKNLRDKPMDALLDFQQIGVDQLAVDEAHCFPYQTEVLTDRGLMKIGDIVTQRLAVGVLSMNTSTGDLEWKAVQQWHENKREHQMVRIKHEAGVLECTANHLIWTEEDGYVEAGKLQPHHTLVLHSEEIRA